MAKLVYKGKIDGKDVTYIEGCFHGPWDWMEGDLVQNKMEVVDGDIKFKFRDWFCSTSINYLSEIEPNFQKDRLGEVIIIKGGKKKYKSRDAYGNTLKGKQTKAVFERANKLYNELREKIRENLREEYSNIAKIIERKSATFSESNLPVKNEKIRKKCIQLIDSHLNSNLRSVLANYFSESKEVIKNIKSLDYESKEKLFQVLLLLDKDFFLSNKITLKLYNDHRQLFEDIVRKSVDDGPSSKLGLEKEKFKQNTSDFPLSFWTRQRTVSYSPKKRFHQPENLSEFERLSFLDDLLKEFYSEEKKFFNKLKSDAKLVYSLKINLYKDHFECRLEEQSIVKKAYKLSKKLKILADDPKMLTSKFDELKKIANEILPKSGVKSIEDILPLYSYAKEIEEFNFSEKDTEAYFFADSQYSKHLNDLRKYPAQFCIFFSKDGKAFKDKFLLRKVEYVYGNNIRNMLEFLDKREWIMFDFKMLRKKLEKIEAKAFKRLKQSERPKNDLERILKIKDVELPQEWYDIRDMYYYNTFRGKILKHFAKQIRKSKLLREIMGSFEINELGKG